MNITINRAELLSAAQKAAAVASENAPLEPLKGALLEADAATNILTVTATNLETSLELKLLCTVGDDDALIVNAKLLAGMLERLPGEAVELKRQAEVPAISLRSDGAGYDVTVLERGSFPKIQIPFPEDTVKVSGIPSMARQTTFATVEDKDRPLLRCVNLMFTQEGLKAVGSNGGCVVTAKGDDKSTGNANLLLPANSLEKLAALCGDEDEFQVGTAGNSIVFMRPGLMLSARLMEGDYVDTGRIMDSIRNQFTVLTDVAELRRALKAVSAVDPKGRVKLTFDSGQIVFSCKGNLGTASESVDIAPLTGAPQGAYWYLIPALSSSLKALSGTVVLGVAQAGMLDLSTEKAYYMQTAVREPAAAPVKVKQTSKEVKVKKSPPKARQSKKNAVQKAA